jgi:signal transduction histidine kinase
VRRWLLLSYLSVVAVVLALLEIPLGVLTARHERDLLHAAAIQQATSVAVVVGEDISNGRVHDLSVLARSYRTENAGEILVDNQAGAPLVDSDVDTFADNPSIGRVLNAARSGRTAVGETTDEGQPMTLAAVPVRNDTGARVMGTLLLALPASASYNRIRDVWYALAAFGVVILALTALLGSRLAMAITRPLRSLEWTVGRFGTGQLAERARPSGPPELRALAAEFNRMAAHIEDLLAVQARFVADASHQLRSPLTALRLRLENLEAAVEGAPDLNGPVVAARLEVQRLSRLVDGLLTLSRADGAPAERVPVDVGDVIAGRVDAWSALADEREVTLRAPTSALRYPAVRLVPGDLEQILDNLLANAFDATPAGRRIAVDVAESDETVTITVTDQGRGMAPEEMARAFDRFWQGGGKRKGSSGLGLAIVRQLARRNGALVELRPGPAATGSAGESNGLPVAAPPADAPGRRSSGASAAGRTVALAAQPATDGSGTAAAQPLTSGLQAVIVLHR